MKNREEIKAKIESMSKEELIDLFIKNEKNEEQLNWYKEQLKILNKLRYSSKSEKTICGQLNLFNEIEDITDNPTEPKETQDVKSRKKKKHKEANFSKLPTKIIEHTLDILQCEVCGDELKELAPQVIDVLKYQPARYSVERHIVHQYICNTCTDENLEAEIITAEGAPKKLIKGSVTSPSVVAGIVFNKYVSAIPLYRQEQELKRQKIEISRANMSNWLMKCGELLEPLYDRMWKDLRKQEHVHMDETTLLVLEDKAQGEREKSYMWMGCSGKWEEQQMALYFYNESREHEFAKDIIGSEYAKGIHSDGYEAYHKFLKAIVYGCWAHARRQFVEAQEVSPLHAGSKKLTRKALEEYQEKNPAYGNIVKIIDKIGYLFSCEKRYLEEDLSPSEIEKRRQEEQKQTLDEIFMWIKAHKEEYSEKSKMGKAMTYALNQEKYLRNYIKDGKAEISNNRGERQIKPFVMGRKNWLFTKTKSGANMSAIYYSLIESAKMNNLDIQKYLEYILEEMKEKGERLEYENITPYSSNLPEYLKIN